MIALFSIYNDYNQPNNNLVVLFDHYPSLDELSKFVGGWDEYNNKVNEAIKSLHSGNEERIRDADYRLEEIEFNKEI